MWAFRCAGKLEIYARVPVGLFSGFNIELAEWDFAGMLVPDGDAVAAKQVVVDLLGGTTVFEDQRNGALSGWSGRDTGRRRLVIGTGLVPVIRLTILLVWRLRLIGLRIIAVVGWSGVVLRGLRVVVAVVSGVGVIPVAEA
jgi:hypothetical protein